MPQPGGPSANLSDFIGAVQTNMNEFLLSKADAANTYQTLAAASSSDSGAAASASAITQVEVISSNLSSNISGLAPRGQSDLWTVPPGVPGPCESLIYFADIDRLYGFPRSTIGNGLRYSDDGGLTWAETVPDVPYIAPMVTGYNGTDKFIALPNAIAGVPHVYSSTDGINFTEGAIVTGHYGLSIPWFNNMFVAAIWTNGTQRISTSPDGVTWTSRPTPGVATGGPNYVMFATDGTQLIAVYDGYAGAMRSLDGINWSPVFGITVGLGGIAYSPEQGLWLGLSPDGLEFTSSDGLNWTYIGLLGSNLGSIGISWVGHGINRWYLASPIQTSPPLPNFNYSLWSTDDPRTTPFFSVPLDGTLADPQGYSIVLYLPTYDRFVMGLTENKFAYSTSRSRDIKAASDNIRVRNCPVATSKYSAAADFNIASTIVETVIAPSSSIGSLTYQAPQPIGSKINLSLVMQNTSPLGDTLTLRFKTQDGTLLTHAIPVAGGADGLATLVNATFVVRTATLSTCSTISQSGIADSSKYAIPAYNPAIFNTFSVTAQWGDSLSTCSVKQFNVSTDFINGA